MRSFAQNQPGINTLAAENEKPRQCELDRFGIPERNYAENLLALTIMGHAAYYSYQVLALRFDERPQAKEGAALRQASAMRESIPRYGKHYGLTEREREVLKLVLEGNDNQNIASEMHLALSTVKVHIHNILKKTNQANRQDLIKDFWRF